MHCSNRTGVVHVRDLRFLPLMYLAVECLVHLLEPQSDEPCKAANRHMRSSWWPHMHTHTHTHTRPHAHTHTQTYAQAVLQSHAVPSKWVSPRRWDQSQSTAVAIHSMLWLPAEPLSLPLTPPTCSRGYQGWPPCRGGGHCAHL